MVTSSHRCADQMRAESQASTFNAREVLGRTELEVDVGLPECASLMWVPLAELGNFGVLRAGSDRNAQKGERRKK